MAQPNQNTVDQEIINSAGAGWAIFAAIIMIMAGVFHALEGLAAIINGNFFFIGGGYVYTINIAAWGWIHLIAGIIVFLAGLAIFSYKTWGRVVGIIVALISAIINFLFIPYYPFWSILLIIMDIAIIWGLANFKNPSKTSYGF